MTAQPSKKAESAVGMELVRYDKAIAPALTERLTAQAWFNKLDDDTKSYLEREGPMLGRALLSMGLARYQVGERLYEIRKALKPIKQFENFIKFYNLKRKTTYTAISDFEEAKALPDDIKQVAMVMGVNIVGPKARAAFKALAPPKGEARRDKTALVEYIKEIDAKQKRHKRSKSSEEKAAEIPGDPRTLQILAFRAAVRGYWKLPHGSPKAAWIKELVAFILGEVEGAGKTVELVTVAPPAGFAPALGRPRAS